MSIRTRIALVSAAAVAVAVVVIAVGTFVGAKRQALAQVDESLLARAHEVEALPPAVLLTILGVERNVRRDDRFVPVRPGDFDTSYYQVILRNGQVVNAGDDDIVLPAPEPDDFDPNGPTLRSDWVDDVHLRIATVVRSEGEAVVQIARPLTEVDALLGRLAALLLFGGFVGVGLAAGLGLLIASQAVKPIYELKSRVGEIAENQTFTERVDVLGDDEVAELSLEFNLLLDELNAAKQEQVRLVRDAGHELRTPLTALRTNLEVLQRHEVDAEQRAQMLSAAHSEVEELASLVAEVVDLATDRYEEETPADVDLGDVANAVAARLEHRRGRHVAVTSDGSVVFGKRQALERALSNVVGNADKFTSSQTAIAIDVSAGTVTVSDDGPGLDERDMPYLFERFYRSDDARSEPGSGLGLSIVKQIVDDHNGTVFARNGRNGGAEVGFSLTVEG